MSLWIDENTDNKRALEVYKKYVPKGEVLKTRPEFAMYPLPYMITGESIEVGAENIENYLKRKQEEKEEEEKFWENIHKNSNSNF